MGDSGKPFACTELGCNQRFVNEDHLEVHRRKHEMSLGLRDLKSLDTPVIADQTPTPTRFLKNCEEVGLYNEHPNPFDALFRRASTLRPSDASETSSKGTLDTPLDIGDRVVEIESNDNERSMEDFSSQQAVSSTTGDENQQNQLQHSEETLLNEDLPRAEQVVEVSTISPTVPQELLSTLQQGQASVIEMVAPMVPNSLPIQQTFQLNRHTIPISGPILLRLPGGQTFPVVPPSVANPQVPIPVAISAVPQVSVVVTRTMESIPLDSRSVKQKLKNNLLANQSQGNMGVMTQAVDVVTRQQGMTSLDSAEIAQELITSPEGHIKRRRRSSDISPDEKREKFLERNRAAATRCRNKRKVWVNSLEQKADEYKNNNGRLMNEVSKLRDEVASLKQLLLAHNECPVTMLQRQNGGNVFTALDMQKNDPSLGGDDCQSPKVEEGNTLQR